jgi:glucosylceramidase
MGTEYAYSINKKTGEIKYNPEYFLMRHLSHFVLPGAYRLKTSEGKAHLAFVNPNGDLVVMIVNGESNDKETTIELGDRSAKFIFKAKSISTLVWHQK